MSIVLLIDGYNVIGPVAAPGRGASLDWLAIERQRLLQRLVEHLDEPVRMRTCVVFDAKDAPKQFQSRYQHRGIDVWFAVDYPEADDLLEEIIAQHPAPKTLSVVSSDRRIAVAARRRRAGCFGSAEWLDHLLDGTTQLIKFPKAFKSAAPEHPAITDIPQPGAHRASAEIAGVDPIDAQVAAMISDDVLAALLRKL